MKNFVNPWRSTARNVAMLFALTLTAASLAVHAQVIPADTTGQTPASNVVFFGAPPGDFDPGNLEQKADGGSLIWVQA